MPQAIATAIIAAVGATGLAATAITVATYVVVTVGLSLLTQELFGPGRPKPSDQQQTIRSAVGSRIRSYGETHVGGQLSFYESSNGILYRVITNGQGEIDEILEHRLNNNVVTVNGSGLVTDAKFQGAIQLFNRLGTDSQTAFSQLTSVFSEWTTNHRQRGCSNTLIICGEVESEEFSEVYEGSRPPEYSQVRKSTKVYDPRKDSTQVIGYDSEGDPIYGSGSHRKDNTSTFEYSDTAALVIADYVAHPDGYGLGWDSVNWVNIAEEADECENTILAASGETIALYRIWGSYRMSDEERKNILDAMMQACDGYNFQDQNSLFNLKVVRWIEPTVHITVDHIKKIAAQRGPTGLDDTSEVKVVYTEKLQDYKEFECNPVIDATATAEAPQRFDILFCPHHNQAVRLGKLLLLRLGDRWQLQLEGDLVFLSLIGERFCYITIPVLAIDEVAFEIESLEIMPAEPGGEVTLKGSFREVRSTDWDFDSATEEGDPPIGPSDISIVTTLEVPQNVTPSVTENAVAGQIVPTLYVAWDAPSRVSLKAEAEYREDGTSDWNRLTVNTEANTAVSGLVESGKTYEVRVRFLAITGKAGDWSATEEVVVGAYTISTPSQFALSEDAGDVTLQCRNPPQGTFDYVKFFRHTSDSFGGASDISGEVYGAPSQVVSYVDTPGSGTFYYWAVAYDTDATPSDETSSETVTI